MKIEACRALGKVGQSEDATVLAQVMALDNLEDARIAAIEGLAELKTKDPRIFSCSSTAWITKTRPSGSPRSPPCVADPQRLRHRPGRLAARAQADARGGHSGSAVRAHCPVPSTIPAPEAAHSPLELRTPRPVSRVSQAS